MTRIEAFSSTSGATRDALCCAPMSSTPAELAARQARDTAKLGPLIRAAGIKVQ